MSRGIYHKESNERYTDHRRDSMARRRVGNAVVILRGSGWRVAGFVALGVLALLLVLVTLGLWGSNGWLPAFVAGQITPRVAIPADAVVTPPEGETVRATVAVDEQAVIHTVDERYLSVAVDLSQVTGGKWWNPDAEGTEGGSGTVSAPVFNFDRPQLNAMVSALSPSYLRIGGSESDKVYYELDERALETDNVPDGYESVLTGGQWDRLNAFAERNRLDVVFTLNAGPSSRDDEGAWSGDNAAALMEYTAARQFPVAVWELGNEVNNFWYVFETGEQIGARRYHRDSVHALELVEELHPSAAFGGQGAMVWPVLGEPLGLFFGMSVPALRRNSGLQDVVSWHYYPQQSRRGPIASRKAHPARLLEPRNLDEVVHWARRFRDARDRHMPDAELWVGETGNAQFGGEPRLSDVYLGGLWWLDQLGALAREQHDVVIRQSLTGMNYGLIDETTLAPRPDFWNSVMWKRLMGPEVLPAVVSSESGDGAKVRAYAHRTAGAPESTTVLLINLHHDRAAEVTVEAGRPVGSLAVYGFSAPDVYGSELLLNGVPFRLSADGEVQEWVITPVQRAGDTVRLPPLGYAFAVLP